MERKNKGRKKIDIERIKRKDYRQVAFSKRRIGLFKKASELCTLCGAETAIIVFSPAGKAFSFGHPSVDTVIDRFLGMEPAQEEGQQTVLLDPHRSAGVQELNGLYTEVHTRLDAEKRHGETLRDLENATASQFQWAGPIENLDYHELEQLRFAMEELKIKVVNRADEILTKAANLQACVTANPGGTVNHSQRSFTQGIQGNQIHNLNMPSRLVQNLNMPSRLVQNLNMPSQLVQNLNMLSPMVQNLNMPSPMVQNLNMPSPMVQNLNMPSPMVQNLNMLPPMAQNLSIPPMVQNLNMSMAPQQDYNFNHQNGFY